MNQHMAAVQTLGIEFFFRIAFGLIRIDGMKRPDWKHFPLFDQVQFDASFIEDCGDCKWVVQERITFCSDESMLAELTFRGVRTKDGVYEWSHVPVRVEYYLQPNQCGSVLPQMAERVGGGWRYLTKEAVQPAPTA